MVELNFYTSTGFFVFAGKKQSSQVGKLPEIQKIQLRNDDNIFLKKLGKINKF